MLWQRTITAIAGIPLALVVVHVGGPWLAAAVALLAIAGLREFHRLAARRSLAPRPWLAYPLGLAAILYAAWRPASHLSPAPEALALLLGLAAIAAWGLVLLPRESGGRLLSTLVGVGYVAHLLSYLLRLRALPGPAVFLAGREITYGELALAGVLVTCWAMDTSAYFVGRALGRHPLCPRVSPHKTREGGLAALAAAILLGTGLSHPLQLSPPTGLLLGLLLGVAGQAGDLFESFLKRQAGLKDSGALLPGHGGVLDRFDSLLLNAPAAYLWLRLVTGH